MRPRTSEPRERTAALPFWLKDDDVQSEGSISSDDDVQFAESISWRSIAALREMGTELAKVVGVLRRIRSSRSSSFPLPSPSHTWLHQHHMSPPDMDACFTKLDSSAAARAKLPVLTSEVSGSCC